MSESNGPEQVGIAMRWIAGFIVAITGAIYAIPKLCRAIVSIARTGVQLNDAMPVVIQLPGLVKSVNAKVDDHSKSLAAQDGVLAQHGETLCEIKSALKKLTTEKDAERPKFKT